MSLVMVIWLVLFCMAIGACLGFLFKGKHEKQLAADYEKKLQDMEAQKLLLAARIKEELKETRAAILKSAVSYEGIVKILEDELNISEDLHLTPPVMNAEQLPMKEESSDCEKNKFESIEEKVVDINQDESEAA